MCLMRTLVFAAAGWLNLGARALSVAAAPRSPDDLSALVSSMSPSATIEVHALTMQMRGNGEEVLSLSVGEPDFPPPKPILDAIAKAASDGKTRYTEVGGTKELRTAIALDLETRKATKYAPEQIVVTNGAKQAVVEAIVALCGPGDEVIVPTPCWVSYPEIVKISGATVVLCETTIEDGYKLKPEALRKALSPRTKALIFCNPSNPTGATLSEEEQRGLLDVLMAHEDEQKIWVVADEIYERLHYDPTEPHVSWAALSEQAMDRTVVVNGFSKAFAMTGFRLGYLAAPPHVAKAALKLQGQLTSCASSLSQAAGVAALNLPADALDAPVAEMKRRRDYVLDRLSKIERDTEGRLRCPPAPQGAFYVLPDVTGCFGLKAPDGMLVDDSKTFCTALLRSRKLALVPGAAFLAPNTARLSYAASMAELEQALDAIETFVTTDLTSA